MTTLSFDKFFDLQSFLMMVALLLLLYENEHIFAIIEKEGWCEQDGHYFFSLLNR